MKIFKIFPHAAEKENLVKSGKMKIFNLYQSASKHAVDKKNTEESKEIWNKVTFKQAMRRAFTERSFVPLFEVKIYKKYVEADNGFGKPYSLATHEVAISYATIGLKLIKWGKHDVAAGYFAKTARIYDEMGMSDQTIVWYEHAAVTAKDPVAKEKYLLISASFRSMYPSVVTHTSYETLTTGLRIAAIRA